MKTRLSSLRRDSGSTYMTVVITMIVVGAMLAAYLQMVSVQNQFTMRSQTWNRSVPVLEAGVEDAMAHLNKNAAADDTGTFVVNLTADGWQSAAGGGWYKVAQIGEDFYYTKITSFTPGTVGYYPFIQSVGYVKQLPTLSWRRTAGPFLAAVSLDQLLSSSSYSKRTVMAGTTNVPTFSKALVAKHGIDLNGNNVATDSYDSKIPAYNTLGRWDVSKRRDHGDVASNDTVTNSVNVGNANIWGRVSTGPRGTVSVGSNGKVGDAAWQARSDTAGKIEPGFSTDDMNVQFPDVRMPSGSGAWVISAGSGVLTSGDYLVPGSVNGSITIAANATVRLRVDGGWSFNGNSGLTISSNAHLTVYLNCPSANIQGNGIINSYGTPDQCYIYGTSRLTSLDMGGNGEATCAVYAPSADVTLHGGGNSDQDFSGALIANTFRFVGHYLIHYDEALGRNGLYRGYTLTSWNEQ